MLRNVLGTIVLMLLAIPRVTAQPAAAADSPPLRLATFQSDVTLPLGDILYSEVLKTIEHPLLAKGRVRRSTP